MVFETPAIPRVLAQVGQSPPQARHRRGDDPLRQAQDLTAAVREDAEGRGLGILVEEARSPRVSASLARMVDLTSTGSSRRPDSMMKSSSRPLQVRR